MAHPLWYIYSIYISFLISSGPHPLLTSTVEQRSSSSKKRQASSSSRSSAVDRSSARRQKTHHRQNEGSEEEKKEETETVDIVDILKRANNSDNIEEVRGALHQLWSVIQSANNVGNAEVAKTASYFGVELALSRAMENFPEQAKIQSYVLSIMVEITYGEEGHCQKVIDFDALKYCLDVMGKFPSQYSMLADCCTLLGNLMIDDKITKQVIDGSGLQAVITILENNPNGTLIQECGCYALLRASETAWAKKVAEAGGIKLVVKAMKDHKNIKIVQLHGCRILYNLATIDASCLKQVNGAGGMVAVAASLHLHGDDKDVDKAAKKAMSVLLSV